VAIGEAMFFQSSITNNNSNSNFVLIF